MPDKHKFVFLADDSLRKRADALLKKASFRVLFNDQSDLLRHALVDFLERHEKSHAHSPAVTKSTGPKTRTRTPKPYAPGPNAGKSA